MKIIVRMVSLFFLIAGFITLAMTPVVHAENLLIICNKEVPDTSLSKNDIKNIFLGMKTKWSDGHKITFVVLKGSEVHEEFVKKYVRKTAFQFNTYWRKRLFTGKGKPPKSFSDEAALLKYIADTHNAIGYISTASKNDTVRVISVK